MAKQDPTTVILRGTDQVEYKERPASGTVSPGEVVEYSGGNVQSQSTEGGVTTPMFAIERRARGMLADDPDGLHDEYADGEYVLYGLLDKGHQAWAFLAAGESVSDGTPLVMDGSGGFQAIDQDGTAPDDSAGAVVAQAIETVDNSGASERTRVRVEVV